MNQLIYNGWTFSDDEVGSGNYFSQTSLTASSLGINTLEANVKCPDPTITDFQQNSPVTYFHKGQQMGIYYLQSVERTGPDRYTLSCVSAMGLLSQQGHVGGIYTGHTVEEVVASICGEIPVQIKNNLRGVQLYGWLPYVAPPKTSAKDNLSQVLFAIGAAVTNDLNGVLRIEPLYRGLSGVLDDDSVCEGGSVVTDSLVTAVSVTEHQYFKGTETKELFEGSTLAGDVITFSEPMHSLVAEGFELLEIGANYAVVSSGSGTLTGSVYVHNTRQVTATVAEGPVDNVKSVEDATLVSLVNSTAVVQRMAAYYRCRETIKTPAIITAEHPGAVVSIFHPYDKKQVRACIASSDVNMSATLKAKLEALVGYEPPDLSQSEYYDFREVLTGAGEWTVPDGVSTVTAVLIGAGKNGTAGENGTENYGGWKRDSNDRTGIGVPSGGTSTSVSVSDSVSGGDAGLGGAGGLGGLGGKILRIELDVSDLKTIAFFCGQGNDSAEFETTFGAHSTASGTTSEAGYYDVVTGEVFAKSGINGADGGNGGSPGSSGVSVGNATGGNGAPQESDTVVKTNTSYSIWNVTLNVTGNFGGAGGGGAGGNAGDVQGENGGNAAEGSAWGNSVSIDNTSSTAIVGHGYSNAKGFSSGRGGNGANGLDASNYGCGGDGGAGGGGAGACGSVSVNGTLTGVAKSYSSAYDKTSIVDYTVYVAAGSPTDSSGTFYGLGGTGGIGADGCIILYYEKPKERKSGAVMDRTFRFVRDRTGRLMIV